MENALKRRLQWPSSRWKRALSRRPRTTHILQGRPLRPRHYVTTSTELPILHPLPFPQSANGVEPCGPMARGLADGKTSASQDRPHRTSRHRRTKRSRTERASERTYVAYGRERNPPDIAARQGDAGTPTPRRSLTTAARLARAADKASFKLFTGLPRWDLVGRDANGFKDSGWIRAKTGTPFPVQHAIKSSIWG